MQALVNASLVSSIAAALAQDHGWQLRSVPSVAEAVSQMSSEDLANVEALVVEVEPIDEKLIGSLPSLRLIGCLRSEPINIDVASASAHEVVVVHTPGRNAGAVAEFTLGLCLAMIRNIAVSHHGIVARELTSSASNPEARERKDVIWRSEDPDLPIPSQMFRGRQLAYLSVAIIGYGLVGQAVARAFSGLAREVVVADPFVAASVVAADGYRLLDLDSALAFADVVSVHARSSTPIIGVRELAMMRHGAYLINTARATVLDYDALSDALASGKLAAAALDVFPEEPLPQTSKLLEAPHLTMTPHLAGAAREVADRQSEIFLEAVRGIESHVDWSLLPIRNRELQASWEAHWCHDVI